MAGPHPWLVTSPWFIGAPQGRDGSPRQRHGSHRSGPGAICSVAPCPCLPSPGLHGDVMLGSAPPVTG